MAESEAQILGENPDGSIRVGQPMDMVEPDIFEGTLLNLTDAFGTYNAADGSFKRAFVVTDAGTLVLEPNDGNPLLINLSESNKADQLQAVEIDPNVGTLGDFLSYGTRDGVMHHSEWVVEAVFEQTPVVSRDFAMENMDSVSAAVQEAAEIFARLSDREIAINQPAVAAPTYDVGGAKRLIGLTLGDPTDIYSTRSRVVVIAESPESVDLSSALGAQFSNAYLTTEGGQTYRLSKAEAGYELTDRKGSSTAVTIDALRDALDSPVKRIALEEAELSTRLDAAEATGNQHDFAVESFDRSVRNSITKTPDTGRSL